MQRSADPLNAGKRGIPKRLREIIVSRNGRCLLGPGVFDGISAHVANSVGALDCSPTLHFTGCLAQALIGYIYLEVARLAVIVASYGRLCSCPIGLSPDL
jgi:hypothetical protein